MTIHSGDVSVIRGKWSFFHREETLFYRMMPVNRRIVPVQRHAEHVHPANARSPCGLGHTQCRKVSSPGQRGSCSPRDATLIPRKLRVIYREMSILRGKRRA